MFRRLNKIDRNELLEISRIAQSYKFVANQIKANTALVKDGQKLAKQYEDIAKLVERVKDSLVAQKLTQLGYPQGVSFNVDLRTGKIKKPKYAQLPPQPEPKK